MISPVIAHLYYRFTCYKYFIVVILSNFWDFARAATNCSLLLTKFNCRGISNMHSLHISLVCPKPWRLDMQSMLEYASVYMFCVRLVFEYLSIGPDTLTLPVQITQFELLIIYLISQIKHNYYVNISYLTHGNIKILFFFFSSLIV